MGLINELSDLVSKLSFYKVVNEYEQGLYFKNGIVVERKIRRTREELEKITAEERRFVLDQGGLKACVEQYKEHDYPSQFRKSRVTGRPLSLKRFEKAKILRPGPYRFIPIISRIEIEPKKEKVLDLRNINVPAADIVLYNVTVSGNLRYELLDMYRAYTEVDDYEKQLGTQSLSILTEHCMGKKTDEWKSLDNKHAVERSVIKDIREIGTDRWGLKLHEFKLSDIVITSVAHGGVYRVLVDGQSVNAQTIPVAVASSD